MSDADLKKRVEALLEAAAREDPAKVLAMLTERFGDEHPFVRRAALDALGRLAEFRGLAIDAETTGLLARMANDADPGVRGESAVALALATKAQRPSETVRLTLHRLLADPEAVVRREAAAALGDVADESAKDDLAFRMEKDDDDGVRFEAAFALAAMHDERALPVLTSALEKPKIRLDACEGLRRLQSRAALPALEKLATRFFLAWPDRLTALATMHALGDPAAGNGVLEQARARNREQRAYALSLIGSHRIAQGLHVLIDVATNAKDPLRDTAVRALAELGDPSAVDILARIADEDSAPSELRADAKAAIEKLRRGGSTR